MGILIFLAVTVIGGILFIINGISVLIGDCAAVTFDDSRRIGGRSFIIRATCLNEQQAAASDIPTWMGGWGMIVLGILAITAFLWLLPILNFFAQRKAAKQQAEEEWAYRNQVASRYMPEYQTIDGKVYRLAAPNAIAKVQGLYHLNGKWYRIEGGTAHFVPINGWQKLPKLAKVGLWILFLSPAVFVIGVGILNNT